MSPPPEPSEKDIRRLQALETRLATARESQRAWTVERRELKARLAEADRGARRTARATADVVAKAERQVEQLIEVNRRLAEQEAAAVADRSVALAAAERAVQALRPLQVEVLAAREKLRQLETSNKSLSVERDSLRKRLGIAEAQLSNASMARVLPPEEVAAVVGELVDQVRGNLRGLQVDRGEVKLRMAFAKVGDQLGLVAPTPDAPAEVRASLNEITLQLGRRPDDGDEASPPVPTRR